MPAPSAFKDINEKAAIAVERAGLPSRVLSSTVGRIGGAPMLLMGLDQLRDPTQWQGKDKSVLDRNIASSDTRALALKQLAEDMAKARPQELGGHTVVLGGTNLTRDIPRILRNPRTSILGKALGIGTYPAQALQMALARGSHYNPFSDTSHIYGNSPAVLSHELGHAIDFNRLPVPQYSKDKSKVLTFLKRQGLGAVRDAYAASRSIPIPFAAAPIILAQEALANRESEKALKDTYKNDPEKLQAILKDRTAHLPGGYASYMGFLAANNGIIPVDPQMAAMGAMAIGSGLGKGVSLLYGKKKDKHEPPAIAGKIQPKKEDKAMNSKPERKKAASAFAFGEKVALLSWGGRNFSAAPRGVGVGLNAGWDHIYGVLPVPYAGIDIGGPHHGLQLSGPLPGIGFRAGLFSRPPGLSSSTSYPRSLWKTLADGSADPAELEEQQYQEGLKRFKNLNTDEIASGLGYMQPELSQKMQRAVAQQLFNASRRGADKIQPKKEDKAMNSKPERKKAASAIDPAFIAPLAGAALGGGIGALSSKKNRLRNALIGAGVGGSVGSAGEYTLPGLGLGGKYTAQDLAQYIKSKTMGNPGYLEGLSGAANRIGEMGEYSMRRHSTLPGLELAYLPGHFKKSEAPLEVAPAMPPELHYKYNDPNWDEKYKAETQWRKNNRQAVIDLSRKRGLKLFDNKGNVIDDSVQGNNLYSQLYDELNNKQRFIREQWDMGHPAQSPAAPAAPAPTPAAPAPAGMTIQQRLNALNAARRAQGGEVAEGPSVVGQVDKALATGAKSTSPFPSSGSAPVTAPPKPMAPIASPPSGTGAAGIKAASALEFGQKIAAGPLTAEKPIAPNTFLRAAAAEDGPFSFSDGHLLRATETLPLQQMGRKLQERHEDAVGAYNSTNTTPSNKNPRLVPATPSYQAPALPTPPAASPPRGTGRGAPPAPVQMGKRAASALEFGAKIAESAGMSDHTALVAGGTGLGARYGAMAGAALGGIHGLMSPGEVDGEDEDGNPIKRKRNRLMGALRGAGAGLGLGLVGGGAAGGLAQHLNPGLLAAIDPQLDRHLLDRAATSRGQAPSYQKDLPAAQVEAVSGMR